MFLHSKISFSIIFGTAIGMILGTYGFIAIAAPSGVPPAVNVLPFINIGPDLQIKSGDLWVKKLSTTGGIFVGGYLQIAETTGAPPATDCDVVEEVGRIKYDPTVEILYICKGVGGWTSMFLN